jgi:hypothetical protein
MLDCQAAFPVFRDTDRFMDYCVHSLKNQIADLVLPDGVQDELTPHYHREVVSNLLSAIRSLRSLKRDLDPQTMAGPGAVSPCWGGVPVPAAGSGRPLPGLRRRPVWTLSSA